MDDRTEGPLEVHLREYEALRQEMALRLEEKHELMRYVLLLLSGIVAGLWSGTTNELLWEVSLLLVVPTISVLLASMYSWHDEMIATLACYLDHELAPRIRTLSGRENVMTWERFIGARRKGLPWKVKGLLMRAVFFVPIPVSVFGYLVASARPSRGVVLAVLLVLNTAILAYMVAMFISVDRTYRAYAPTTTDHS